MYTSWFAPTNILPFCWYLATTAAGVFTPAPPSTTAAINASGVYDVVLVSNDPIILDLVVVCCVQSH